MSGLPQPLNAERSLRRAENILTSNRRMVSDIAPDNAPPPTSATTGSIKRNNKLTTSIKRTFRNFRIHSSFRQNRSFHEASESAFDLSSSQNDADASDSHTGHSYFLTNSDVDLASPSSEVPPSERLSFQEHTSPIPSSQPMPSLTIPTAVASEDDSERTLLRPSVSTSNVTVPQLLRRGTPMTKVSSKKHKTFVFRLEVDLGQIIWESKQQKISKHFFLSNILFLLLIVLYQFLSRTLKRSALDLTLDITVTSTNSLRNTKIAG